LDVKILTINSMQLSKMGIEKTVEINNPLSSKYCCFENVFQFSAAYSLMLSEKYTTDTDKEIYTYINTN